MAFLMLKTFSANELLAQFNPNFNIVPSAYDVQLSSEITRLRTYIIAASALAVRSYGSSIAANHSNFLCSRNIASRHGSATLPISVDLLFYDNMQHLTSYTEFRHLF
jgi:hypothetical protein